MASFLNSYCNFINVLTKVGQTLLSNATDKFKSPLNNKNKISLQPGGKDYQKLKDKLTRLSQKIGYKDLLNNVARVCTVTPTILAIVADALLAFLLLLKFQLQSHTQMKLRSWRITLTSF